MPAVLAVPYVNTIRPTNALRLPETFDQIRSSFDRMSDQGTRKLDGQCTQCQTTFTSLLNIMGKFALFALFSWPRT